MLLSEQMRYPPSANLSQVQTLFQNCLHIAFWYPSTTSYIFDRQSRILYDHNLYSSDVSLGNRGFRQKTEIRSYIKCRIRLNIDSKQIFNELCGIYGPQTTVFRWVKAFKAGKFSVEDDTRPGRPKTSVTKANIAAVKIVVEQDARLSVKDIASCTGIQKPVCKQFWKSVWTLERFALGGYLICSLRSKRHKALNVPRNFWKHTKAVIVGLFLTC